MIKLKLIILLPIITLLIQCVENKNAVSHDEKLIRKARQKSNEAIALQDTVALASVWTSDYHIISSRNFEVSGLENNRHLFAKEFATRKEILYVRTSTKIETFPQWNMASENGTWTGQWREPDGLVKFSGTYFAKWHKLKGEWKIRAEIFVPLSCAGSEFCEKNPLY